MPSIVLRRNPLHSAADEMSRAELLFIHHKLRQSSATQLCESLSRQSKRVEGIKFRAGKRILTISSGVLLMP